MIDADFRQVLLQLRRDRDLLAERALEQLDQARDEAREVQRSRLERRAPGEGQQPAGELCAAMRSLDGTLDAAERLLVPLERALHQVEIADHDAQHVVEVVGDPAGQTADGLELRGVLQAELELLALGHVEPHAEELDPRAALIAVDRDLVEDVPLRAVRVAPAIFQSHGTDLGDGAQIRQHAVPVFRFEAGLPEAGSGKSLAREAGDALDAVVGEVKPPVFHAER